MNRSTQRELVVTTPPAPLYEVPLLDNTVWRGTWRELLATYPEWKDHAKKVLPAAPAIELDYADADTRKSSMPRSAINYQTRSPGQQRQVEWHPGQVIQRRRSAQAANETEDIPQARKKKWRGLRAHPLVYLGLGGMVMLVLWVGAAWVHVWWLNTQDDWKYTSTFRTFSIDQAVGHGDSQSHKSHFIAQNDDRRIIIIEFPGNGKSKAVIYSGPTMLGDGEDKTPVFLSFQLNPQTNRLDMVLHVQDQLYIFANNGTKFLEPSV